MKTFKNYSILLLNVFYFIILTVKIVLLKLNYMFLISNDIITFSLISIIIISLFYFALLNKDKESKLFNISVSILPLTTTIFIIWGGMFFLEKHKLISIILALIAFLSTIIIFNKIKKRLVIKTISVAITFLVLIPFCFIMYFSIAFDGFSADKLIQTKASPNRLYTDEVISSDQGALGGDTFVNVYKNGKI